MNAKNYGQNPEVENKRMKELRSYDILDSLTEKDYDDVTTLASVICDVPIALVSFVDKDRQWFKANHGLPVSETHRQHSFCSHAILTPGEPFIVEDSRLDDRFKDNPYVTGNPNIVFYAGIPLVTDSGHGLGSFCIIDDKPRVLTERQMEALKILAAQVMNLLENRKKNTTLTLEKELLEIKTKNLDAIIASRISEIEAQKNQLEKANKELQAFNYISSHDLQEPLRKIQTFLSIIHERDFDNLSEKGKEYLTKTSKASARMSALIKDLLAYSRTTLSKKTYDNVSLKAVVADVTHDLEEDITNKAAVITLTQDAGLNVIAFQFRQLVYNLLGNSIKFSQPGTSPHITIGYEMLKKTELNKNHQKQEHQYHVITFTDNGIGFDNQYREKIFELFQRLETKELQSGTGIGLAIVKKIVENHKGFIEAQSTPDKGTTFKIMLPVQ